MTRQQSRNRNRQQAARPEQSTNEAIEAIIGDRPISSCKVNGFDFFFCRRPEPIEVTNGVYPFPSSTANLDFSNVLRTHRVYRVWWEEELLHRIEICKQE